MEYRLISIGALSRHELWREAGAARTAHATTTLVESENRRILVDPGLPAQALRARLRERAGIEPDQITDVFLTNFRPSHRRGLDLFGQADWWIAEMEREAVGRMLVERFQLEDASSDPPSPPAGLDEAPSDGAGVSAATMNDRGDAEGGEASSRSGGHVGAGEVGADQDIRSLLRAEIAMLKRFKPAPDRLADRVDIFPLPGFTPGNCGLLLLEMNATILLAGDAVASREHLNAGRVLQGAYDLDTARESLREAAEIADAIIPAHDDMILNRTRRMM